MEQKEEGRLNRKMTTQKKLLTHNSKQEIVQGDCLEVMRGMQENSIDFIVTDPPYGLHFMGKDWDKFKRTTESENPKHKFVVDSHYPEGHWKKKVKTANSLAGEYDKKRDDEFQEFMRLFGIEALRVLKPGGMLAMFGAPRRHHRQMSGLEDAGFEIRDVIAWIFGQGFPKSLDVSKAIDKAKGCEREVVGKKIDISSGKEMSTKQARGGNSGEKSEDWNRPWKQDEKALQDNCLITKPYSELAKTFSGYGTALKPAYEPIIICMKPLDGTFAQNAEKWGVAGINVDESRIGTDEIKTCGGNKFPKLYGEFKESKESTHKGRWPSNLILSEESAEELDQMTENNVSRFFYCAKASSSERNRGLEGLPLKETSGCYGEFEGDGRGRQTEHQPKQNTHPTVKPIDLMKYILKLLAPPGDPVCLDPFAGSGSTLVAAKELDISCIGIEKELEYCEIAKKRRNYARKKPHIQRV